MYLNALRQLDINLDICLGQIRPQIERHKCGLIPWYTRLILNVNGMRQSHINPEIRLVEEIRSQTRVVLKERFSIMSNLCII